MNIRESEGWIYATMRALRSQQQQEDEGGTEHETKTSPRAHNQVIKQASKQMNERTNENNNTINQPIIDQIDPKWRMAGPY